MTNLISVHFGKLNAENLKFVEARVAEKSCPVCVKKGEFRNNEGDISVVNICCERFAEIIGNSPSVKNINNYAIEFRGKIINTFCFLENFIDAIIENAYTQYPEEFIGIYPSENSDGLNMREKKRLLKKCLDKYNLLTNHNIEQLWGHFSNVVERRNHLAHWAVDASSKGVELLNNKKSIRFINFKSPNVHEEDIYNSKKTFLLEQKIKKLTLDIIAVHEFFRDHKKNGI